jgi:hypothetical protein
VPNNHAKEEKEESEQESLSKPLSIIQLKKPE